MLITLSIFAGVFLLGITFTILFINVFEIKLLLEDILCQLKNLKKE